MYGRHISLTQIMARLVVMTVVEMVFDVWQTHFSDTDYVKTGSDTITVILEVCLNLYPFSTSL